MNLKEFLNADPAYGRLDANAAAARANERVLPGTVACARLFELIMNRGWYAKIVRLSRNDAAPPVQQDAAIAVLSLLADRDRVINYANAESGARIVEALDALIAGEALDAATKLAVLALGQNLRTRAEAA